MRIVLALGGNALLRRGEPMTQERQRANAHVAAVSLAAVAAEHQIVVTHGNGPQVGLLALEGASYKPEEAYSLDVLGAETEGMIGYLIEQELGNIVPKEQHICTVLTMIEVDAADPAFTSPSKPIGPVYSKEDAERLAKDKGWAIAPDGDMFRRVVASPDPKRIFELGAIRLLMDNGVIVICAGGGGIPTAFREDGSLAGVEAVIDKDRAGALLAEHLGADRYLMLTDVDAVVDGWGTPQARKIRRAGASVLRTMDFAGGSMAPKVEAACHFAEAAGRPALIGSLADAQKMLAGAAGTTVDPEATHIEFWS